MILCRESTHSAVRVLFEQLLKLSEWTLKHSAACSDHLMALLNCATSCNLPCDVLGAGDKLLQTLHRTTNISDHSVNKSFEVARKENPVPHWKWNSIQPPGNGFCNYFLAPLLADSSSTKRMKCFCPIITITNIPTIVRHLTQLTAHYLRSVSL